MPEYKEDDADEENYERSLDALKHEDHQRLAAEFMIFFERQAGVAGNVRAASRRISRLVLCRRVAVAASGVFFH